jgi:hypothetical protein
VKRLFAWAALTQEKKDSAPALDRQESEEADMSTERYLAPAIETQDSEEAVQPALTEINR